MPRPYFLYHFFLPFLFTYTYLIFVRLAFNLSQTPETPKCPFTSSLLFSFKKAKKKNQPTNQKTPPLLLPKSKSKKKLFHQFLYNAKKYKKVILASVCLVIICLFFSLRYVHVLSSVQCFLHLSLD